MFFIGCHGDKNILVPFLCCGKFFSGANFPVLVNFFICDLHVHVYFHAYHYYHYRFYFLFIFVDLFLYAKKTLIMHHEKITCDSIFHNSVLLNYVTYMYFFFFLFFLFFFCQGCLMAVTILPSLLPPILYLQ